MDEFLENVKQKECEHCKKPFITHSDKAKYCSDTCRTLAYRKRKKEKEANKNWIQKLDLKHWIMISIIVIETVAIILMLSN